MDDSELERYEYPKYIYLFVFKQFRGLVVMLCVQHYRLTVSEEE